MEEKINTMTKLKKKSKTRKIVIAVVIAVVLLVFISTVLVPSPRADAEALLQQQTQTDEVTKRSLVKSVGATGTVTSIQSKELSVSLTNAEVAEVTVEVGDSVSKGDKLLAFDTEDIEKNLESAQKSLKTAEQKNNLQASDAARNVTDAERTENYQVDAAKTKVTNAKSDYETAKDDYNTAKKKLNKLKTKEADAKEAYESADQTDTTKLAELKSKYETAKNSRKQYEDTVSQLKSQMTAQKSNYDAAVKDYENTKKSQESSVSSAKSSQASANLNANTDNEKNQVEQYEQQLEDGVLTAPIDGIVTSIQYEAGDTYNGGAILTIQDCSAYEIEAEIGEYDISDVALGQRALIKTNATGDEELEGTVTYISPTATKDAIGTSGDVTYTVRISLADQNDRLRLDMSASISIIMEEHDDVYTVPYNAVQTDADDKSYIEEVSEDGSETQKIYVTIVMESNYYTEIEASDIYEGQKILVIDTDDSENNGFFNMTGGDRSGGGF